MALTYRGNNIFMSCLPHRGTSNCAIQIQRMNFLLTIILSLFCISSIAQQADSTDTTVLETITIKAFEQGRKLKDVAAAVSFIDRRGLERFGAASVVQAVNTVPGVRMEERSPGSYRINIRGSSLRSPFGVRNTKVYYNGLPFTNPGGDSYLNALGSYNYSSIEIIKGPGSSVYGAGSGGVLLIEGLNAAERAGVTTEMSSGSFGYKNVYAGLVTQSETSKNSFGFQFQESNGYRRQSSLSRSVFSWNGSFTTSNKAILKTTFLYSRLFYETPGALTRSEYEMNPRAARPAAGGFPGAETAKASIKQNTFLAGVNYEQPLSQALSNTTSAYGMFTTFDNPAVRNYGRTTEPHVGGRTVFQLRKSFDQINLAITTGAEAQQSFSTSYVYKNKNGAADTLQTADEIPTRQALIFLQSAVETGGWELTAGASLNYLDVRFKRSYPSPLPWQERKFSPQTAPRISLAKRLRLITVYAAIAKGFSPPTTSELVPSGSAVNLSLNAETGTNYELGFKGLVKNLSYDVTAFYFHLQNTVVQRRDAGGGDYYTNAGRTSQQGLETALNYWLFRKAASVTRSNLWFNHTLHIFRYKDFKQLVNDYSNKRLPGTAPHTISTGLDVLLKNGFAMTISYYFSDRIPLNDANSEYANSYQLFNARLGYEKSISDRWRLKLIAGAENLLDQRYSLGNDLNAAGGRYYNAAAGRNFYASLLVNFLAAKK